MRLCGALIDWISCNEKSSDLHLSALNPAPERPFFLLVEGILLRYIIGLKIAIARTVPQ